MLKSLLIFAVLVGFGVGILSAQKVPSDAPKQRIAKRNSGEKGQKEPQAQDGDKNTQTPVPSSPQPTAPTCDESCQQGRQNIKIQNRLVWFTGGLVLVGLFQVGGMIWQAILLRQTRGDVHAQAGWMKTQTGHMGTQADLMEKQNVVALAAAKAAKDNAESALRAVKLQEAQLRQWVEIADWEATAPHIGPGAISTSLTISGDIGNPTTMPITLKSIIASAEKIWGSGDRQDISHQLQYALAPQHPYPIKITFPVKGRDFVDYKKRELGLAVTVKIGFEDAFDVLREQEFGFTCKCGPINFSEFTVYQNTHATEKQSHSSDKS